MIKHPGRPKFTDEQKKEQYNVRLTAEQQFIVKSLFPDPTLTFSGKIVACIEEVKKLRTELISYTMVAEDEDLIITPLKEGVECLTYNNRYIGENNTMAFLSTSFSEIIKGFVKKERVTPELFIDKIIPFLNEQGVLTQVVSIDSLIFGVWALKPKNPCTRCKEELTERITAAIYNKE
jgi:hypothetical protein